MATGLDLALRAAVALVFLASSWPKLRRPRGFILTVLEYRVLPTRVAHLAGRTIPAAEFLVVLLLASGVAVRLGAALACLLLVGFMIGIAVNLARGRQIDCGCFGARKSRTSGWPVLLSAANFVSAFAIRFPVIADPGLDLTRGAFAVSRNPFGLLYGRDGRLVRKGILSNGGDSVRALLGDASADPSARFQMYPEVRDDMRQPVKA